VPAGVTAAAVAEAGHMPNKDLARSERVSVRQRVVDLLAGGAVGRGALSRCAPGRLHKPRSTSRRPRLATQGIGSARSLRLKTSSQKTSSHIATQRSLRNSCPFGDPFRASRGALRGEVQSGVHVEPELPGRGSLTDTASRRTDAPRRR